MKTIEEQLVLWYTDSLYDDLEAMVTESVLKYDDKLNRMNSEGLKRECAKYVLTNGEFKNPVSIIRRLMEAYERQEAPHKRLCEYAAEDYKYFLGRLFMREVSVHMLMDPGIKITRQIVLNKFEDKINSDPKEAAEALIDLYTGRIKSMNAEELVSECNLYSVAYR